MSRFDRAGALAGAASAVLFVVAAIVFPTEPDFDAAAGEVAAFLADNRTQIQIGAAISALWAPLFVWFLATVAGVARGAGEPARRAGGVAFGCGLVLITLYMADVGSLAVAALRPENMLASPEVAASLRDFSWLIMGMAAPAASALMIAVAVIAFRREAPWPRWVGWLSAAAAAAYALRVGTLFTDRGVFAADGVLGLWVPVTSLFTWLLATSVTLAAASREA